MAETTGISWTDHTFNPWWGCVKVSPGCNECYAEKDSKRYGHAIWGKDAPRRFFTDKHWNDPVKWNKAAIEAGEQRRVFCASMADILEEHDNPETMAKMDQERQRLWQLIMATPRLTWLLLTKRPMNFRKMLPMDWLNDPLPNVWLMTTVEDTERTWRIPELLKVPAIVHGISYEPALEYVDFKAWMKPVGGSGSNSEWVNWVITGGESGHKARTFDLRWAEQVQRDCAAHDVTHFIKQAGDNPLWNKPFKFTGKGKDPTEWPEWMRVQEFPA